jgi:hypothetical protein
VPFLILHCEMFYNCKWAYERALKRIFGPERDEVAGALRKLHDEFHNFCDSPNIIRVIIRG